MDKNCTPIFASHAQGKTWHLAERFMFLASYQTCPLQTEELCPPVAAPPPPPLGTERRIMPPSGILTKEAPILFVFCAVSWLYSISGRARLFCCVHPEDTWWSKCMQYLDTETHEGNTTPPPCHCPPLVAAPPLQNKET